MLWELLFFLRKSLQFYQMLYIIHLLFTDGFPSGQRGQTVNLLAPPSKVRILLHPANLALTSLRCRSYFFVQKWENRKGAAKPRPLLHTPRAFFRSSWLWRRGGCWLVPVCFGIGGGTLCRSGSCMLRYWGWGAVPSYFFGDTAGCFIGYGLF